MRAMLSDSSSQLSDSMVPTGAVLFLTVRPCYLGTMLPGHMGTLPGSMGTLCTPLVRGWLCHRVHRCNTAASVSLQGSLF